MTAATREYKLRIWLTATSPDKPEEFENVVDVEVRVDAAVAEAAGRSMVLALAHHADQILTRKATSPPAELPPSGGADDRTVNSSERTAKLADA